MNLTFSLGPECAGGNHLDVTSTLDARKTVMPVTFSELVEPLTGEDEDELVRLMLRLLVSTTGDKALSVVRSKLGTLSIDVELR